MEELTTKIGADARYFLRGDKAENWETLDPILHEREVGLVLNDSKQTVGFKIGDGTTRWKGLPLHTLSEKQDKFAEITETDDYIRIYSDSKNLEIETTAAATAKLSSGMVEIKDMGGGTYFIGNTPINFCGRELTGVKTPTEDSDDSVAATKGYVDEALKNVGGGSSDTVINNLSASLGDNILTETHIEDNPWECGERWNENADGSFTYTGNINATEKTSISISIPNSGENYYLVKFKASPKLEMDVVTVSIGGSATYDLYHGTEDSASDVYYCGVQSEIEDNGDGELVILAAPNYKKDGVVTQWNVTISDITVQQITGTIPAEHVIKDLNGNTLDEYRYSPSETNNNLQNNWRGINSGIRNVTGYGNVGLGYEALKNNTSGFWNVGIGRLTMQANTVGSRNIAIGQSALMSHKSGLRNVAIGSFALSSLTEGYQNIAIGIDAMIEAKSGWQNVAIGLCALKYLDGGKRNVAIGDFALTKLIDGEYNFALGVSSQEENTEGDYNIGIGYQSLKSNTKGFHNTGIGHTALAKTTGNYNVGIGNCVGYSITTGWRNALIGYNCGYDITSGTGNVLIGSECGHGMSTSNKVKLITGSYNILIGHQIDTPTSDATKHLNIGNLIIGNDEVRWSEQAGGDIRFAKYVKINAPLELDFASIPTTDPNAQGKVWNDNGTLKISTGAVA